MWASSATSCTCRSNTPPHVYELLMGGGRGLRHRRCRLPRDQQAAAREALSLLGRRHLARLHALRSRPRLCRVAEEGRFPRPRRAGEGEERRARGAGSAASCSRSPSAALWRRGDLRDGKVLGVTTSAGYGHTIGKSIASATCRPSTPGTRPTRSRPSAAACRRGDPRRRHTIRSGARFSCESNSLIAPRLRLPILTEPAASSS